MLLPLRRALATGVAATACIWQASAAALAEAEGAHTPSAQRFKGRTFIVTGGTSGVGEAVALRLAAEGAAGITIVGRSEERAKKVSERLHALGCEPHFVRAEMDKVDDVRSVVPAHDQRFGSLHGLVNCAGDTSRGRVGDQSVELWDRLFAINARAPFILTQDSTNLMIKKGIQGSVVNIITITAHGGQSFLNAYAASKGALVTFTKNAAHTLRWSRIRVNGVNIGWTETAAEHKTQVAEGAGEDWLEKAEKKVDACLRAPLVRVPVAHSALPPPPPPRAGTLRQADPALRCGCRRLPPPRGRVRGHDGCHRRHGPERDWLW